MVQPTQIALGAQTYDNRGLFSDYYLGVLRGRPEWQALASAAEPARQAVKAILAAFVPGQNEAQTEETLIKPVLRALGHRFEVQASLKTPEGTKTPDYVFYRSEGELNANKAKVLTDALPSQGAFAVGDAKAWDRNLDQTAKGTGGDALSNKNPTYQIYFYMLHSGVDWGILTNGRLWRLYHRTSAHKLDVFYQVDLPALVALDDPQEWLLFWGFFARAAFDEGPLSAGAILRASAEYAQGVSANLKSQVYQALRHIAQGFLDYPANGLAADEQTLEEIHDASLILLYRLLFVLYAEDRALLPLWESDDYRESYSLRSIKHAVAHSLDTGRKLLHTSAKLWPSLRELFGIINAGSPPLKVTTYNGGLFDSARHPFLERYTVGDAHLQQAIDMLSRVNRQFVDYRDLSERHLGTIYEGLLEYHLVPIAAEPAHEQAWQGEWQVALENDKGERHVTGSYYTPDFVVKYITDRALGPVLRERTAGLEDEADIAGAVLSVNIVDPAMGSRHFLVEATEYIARFLVERGVRVPGSVVAEGEPELAAWKRRVVQSCIYGVDLNPLAVELAKLSLWLSTVAKDRPLSFLDHHLRVGNSLVGSWIEQLGPAAAPGKPGKPSKAKAGKKLAAVPASDGAAAVQMSMLDDDAFTRALGTAVGAMWDIEQTPGDTVAEVKQQEQIYARLRDDLHRRYGRLAGVMAAQRLGALEVRLNPAEWTYFVQFASGNALPAMPQFSEWLAEAERLDREHRFFHWELEFPEVWFERDGTSKGDAAGFDAVIGNPPYVRQEALGTYKRYFQAAYRTYHGIADLYTYFYEQGLRLCRAGGRMSYIVTNKWMRAGYGEPLRAFFAEQGVLEDIIDFGHAPIFPDADVFPCIVVLEKQPAAGTDGRTDKGMVHVTSFPREALHKVDLAQYVAEHSHSLPRSRFGSSAWTLETASVDDLMLKIRDGGVPLTEYVGVRPLAGIKTGLNTAFLVDRSKRELFVKSHPDLEQHIKPYLRGRDVKRWSVEWNGLYIILLKSSGDYNWPWAKQGGADAELALQARYPALYSHIKECEPELKRRSDQGRFWWELRSCAYYNVFEGTNIFYQDLAFHSRFALGPPGTIAEMTCFCLPSNDAWLLAVLNSPLMWAYMWRNVIHGKDEVLRLKSLYMERLPIALPPSGVHDEVEQAVARLIQIAQTEQEGRAAMLDWLHTEFGIEAAGQRLEAFAHLDADSFITEARKRRPRSAGQLTPNALKALRAGYTEQAVPAQGLQQEAAGLERRLAELVNQAYGLTEEEVRLLWTTAPPRMPTANP